MPNGFSRSQKGVQEYENLDKEYENTLNDLKFDRFQKETANSPHSKRNKKVVSTMVREMADDGKEYLIYDALDIRYTPLGAERTCYLPNQGKYPIPITQPELRMGENMTTEEISSGPIIRYDVGYEIPFTKANVDKIHEFADDKSQRARTQYILRRAGGAKHTVLKYDDFRDGDFEDIEANGRQTLTDEERKEKERLRKDAEAAEEAQKTERQPEPERQQKELDIPQKKSTSSKR